MGSGASRVHNANMQPVECTEIDLDAIVLDFIAIMEHIKHEIKYKKAKTDTIKIKKVDLSAVKLVNKTQFTKLKDEPFPQKVILFATEIKPKVGNPKIKFGTVCTNVTCATVELKQGVMYGQELKVPFIIPPAIQQHMGAYKSLSQKLDLQETRITQVTDVIQWNIGVEVEATEGIAQNLTVEAQQCEYRAKFTGTTSLAGKVFAVYKDLSGKETYLSRKPLREIIMYLKEVVAVKPRVVSTHVQNMLQQIQLNDGEYVYKITGQCKFRYYLKTKVETDEVTDQTEWDGAEDCL